MGCCCGHAQRGGAKTRPGTLKREMRRTFRQAGLQGRVRLAFAALLDWLRAVFDGGDRGLPQCWPSARSRGPAVAMGRSPLSTTGP